MIRGVVFDIDDTLYPERDYVRSGFAAVAHGLDDPDGDGQAVLEWLGASFDAGLRGRTFDELLVAFPRLADRATVEALVRTYRTHVPDIRLDPLMVDLLDRLGQLDKRLGIVTDGPLESQVAKAHALGLVRWFDPIVYTDALARGSAKPATTAFRTIETTWGLAGSSLVYVADNPAKDFAGPRQLGWRTIRLRGPEQLRSGLEPTGPAFAADLDVGSTTELFDRLTATDGEA